MQKTGSLIHTKLHLPATRPRLVPRARLQEQIRRGLAGPLTLIIAPAGFGKTTLIASCVTAYGMPVAWLSLDRDDNQLERFLSYLVAALQQVDSKIAPKAAQILAGIQHASPEDVLTSLINELDTTSRETVLVLDDYQFISNRAVHEGVAFFLEHCPHSLHVVIAARSDPPLPLSRLRARGQTVELRGADLRFTESEAAQFLNEVMGLRLDAGSVAVLEERTEGWIAGLQMAALSMRGRKDVSGFIKGFSGTNRYILDYLLEEVLVGQPPEIQHFLLCTSILERLTGPLCDATVNNLRRPNARGLSPVEVRNELHSLDKDSNILTFKRSNEILEYLERANLFLLPMDDEGTWYRYHHLFAELLRARLDEIYPGLAPHLHRRAAEWHEQNGAILEAIHHASMVPDDEMVEHLIKQNYLEMMNRGEMSWVRFWMGNLSRELVIRRPWLCLYEAMNRSWFGQLDEASSLLDKAEKLIRAEGSGIDAQSMLAYHIYVKSRVTAMQGDTHQAIEFCLTAREYVPSDSLDLQIDFSITLGYEYFLCGDFVNANQILNETIRSGYRAEAINNPVAAYCLLARVQMIQGRLYEADDLFQKAARLIRGAGGQTLGVFGLVEVGIAALLYERNDIQSAFVRVKQGLDLLPSWGKADDFVLADITLARIQLALGKRTDAAGTVEKAAQMIRTCGVFSEARSAVETTQVRLWLAQGNWLAVNRWASALEGRFVRSDPFRYEDELTHITRARVYMAQNRCREALDLLSCLEESAEAGGRRGRLLEIMILKALVLQTLEDIPQAAMALTTSLTLAESSGYVRIFVEEGQPMHRLLTQWLEHAAVSHLRSYAIHLFSQFDTEARVGKAEQVRTSEPDDLIEPLSRRELEVLHLMALGKTNPEIAQQLIVASGTIKAHAASIYRKLDVANRTEAVTRARLLRILS